MNVDIEVWIEIPNMLENENDYLILFSESNYSE